MCRSLITWPYKADLAAHDGGRPRQVLLYSHGPVIIRPKKKNSMFPIVLKKNRVGSKNILYWEIILYLGSVFSPMSDGEIRQSIFFL